MSHCIIYVFRRVRRNRAEDLIRESCDDDLRRVWDPNHALVPFQCGLTAGENCTICLRSGVLLLLLSGVVELVQHVVCVIVDEKGVGPLLQHEASGRGPPSPPPWRSPKGGARGGESRRRWAPRQHPLHPDPVRVSAARLRLLGLVRGVQVGEVEVPRQLLLLLPHPHHHQLRWQSCS